MSEIGLIVPDTPATGFTVVGSGFPADAWVWITVEDQTDGTQPVDGPEAFQPEADGSFTHTGPTALPCGHTVRAKAFVEDEVVATSNPVTVQGLPAPGEPADPDATSAAKAVYADLLAAPTRPDHRLVIGQALRGWDPTPAGVSEPVTALTAMGLPAPKLLEVDLTDFDKISGRDKLLRDLLQAHADAGGLIGFSYHVGNPFTGGDDKDRNGVDGHLLELADPNNPTTAAGAEWKARLDRIAQIMQEFNQSAVLFRPFHESNGDWFWWGQRDPKDFASVWQGMFHYLSAIKGLHHLLWVYSANRNYGGALLEPARYYPGEAFVDVVGLDIYHDDLLDADPGWPGYAAMTCWGKPWGITEYAAYNGTETIPPHDGAVYLPNDEVIQLIKSRYRNAVLACCWYSSKGIGTTWPDNHWQISDKPNPAALIQDPWAITR